MPIILMAEVVNQAEIVLKVSPMDDEFGRK